MIHQGHDLRRYSDCVSPDDQLHNTVRTGQRGQTSYRHNNCCCESRVNKQINLPDTDSKQPWNHQSSYVPNPRVREGNPKIKPHPLLYEKWYLYQELQNPPHTSPPHDAPPRLPT